jgi:hypothetical protein
MQGLELSTADTHYYVALDEDDPKLDAYYEELRLPHQFIDRVKVIVGPRQNLTKWTNVMAIESSTSFEFLASFGDDHIPETPSWDEALVEAIESHGGACMAFPADGRRDDFPEAIVISSNIVQVLGWMMEPSLTHFHVDNVWADLGKEANCIWYCPQVMVRHHHYQIDPSVARDDTYSEAEAHGEDDHVRYELWRTQKMAQDIQKLRTLRGER